MSAVDAIQLIILVILLCLSAFFSSAETALTAVNKIRIRTLADEGDRNAELVDRLIENPTRMLSAILIGNNLVNIGMTALATLMASRLFGNIGAGIATGVLTVLILIFGEITPKNSAAVSAEKLSLRYAKPVYYWTVCITPVSLVLNAIVRLLLRLKGLDPDWKDTYTENEIRTIVDESHEDGEIESEEREMINNVFDLDENAAKDVMIPRVDMVFLDVNASFAETLAIYRECLYTRLPVYEGDTDVVIGMINIKDMLLIEDEEHFRVRDILREVYFTHEYKKTSELMQEMLKNGITLAIVLDEYGDTAGLITMEDLLEEIVGEIRDEYDEEEEEEIREVKPGEFVVDGSSKLEDLNDRIEGLDLQSEEYDSIGGIIIGLLDRLPDDGDEVMTEDGVRLKVDGVDHNHIDKVDIFLPERKEKEDKV